MVKDIYQDNEMTRYRKELEEKRYRRAISPVKDFKKKGEKEIINFIKANINIMLNGNQYPIILGEVIENDKDWKFIKKHKKLQMAVRIMEGTIKEVERQLILTLKKGITTRQLNRLIKKKLV